MGEVAGVLVGDGQVYRLQCADQTEAGEKFAGVFDQGGEALGLFGIVSIVTQEKVIFLHRRAAARGIDDNGIDSRLLETRRYYAEPSA